MLIILKRQGSQEFISTKNILKFTKDDNQDQYELVLSEVFSPRDFIIKNIVLLINAQTQPLSFSQIQEYLKINSSL
jgi:hypothetical protein